MFVFWISGEEPLSTHLSYSGGAAPVPEHPQFIVLTSGVEHVQCERMHLVDGELEDTGLLGILAYRSACS